MGVILTIVETKHKDAVVLNARGDIAFWSELDGMLNLLPGIAQQRAREHKWSGNEIQYKAIVKWSRRKDFYSWLDTIGEKYNIIESQKERRDSRGTNRQPRGHQLGSQRKRTG